VQFAWLDRIERGRDQLAGNLRLGSELDPLCHAGFSTARPVCSPVLGQIQPPVDQRMAIAARVTEEHADLAILDPSGRA
jgi:hypothetical protein